jgi:hypothetical protein
MTNGRQKATSPSCPLQRQANTNANGSCHNGIRCIPHGGHIYPLWGRAEPGTWKGIIEEEGITIIEWRAKQHLSRYRVARTPPHMPVSQASVHGIWNQTSPNRSSSPSSSTTLTPPTPALYSCAPSPVHIYTHLSVPVLPAADNRSGATKARLLLEGCRRLAKPGN